MKRTDAIEQWFRQHEDGEFVVLPARHLSSWCGDPNTAAALVYTTKPSCLPQLARLPTLPKAIASLGRYGLPLRSDLNSLSKFSESRPWLFVGDADPPDLFIFSWLREQIAIQWVGVNDQLLDSCSNLDAHEIRIEMTETEKLAASHLPEFCADYRDLVGGYCASVLDGGCKVELEGAIMDRSVGLDA